MKAARIHEFGSPDVITIDDVPIPTPKEGEILVRVAAAGVGPWDALLRERKPSPIEFVLKGESHAEEVPALVDRWRWLGRYELVRT